MQAFGLAMYSIPVAGWIAAILAAGLAIAAFVWNIESAEEKVQRLNAEIEESENKISKLIFPVGRYD